MTKLRVDSDLIRELAAIPTRRADGIEISNNGQGLRVSGPAPQHPLSPLLPLRQRPRSQMPPPPAAVDTNAVTSPMVGTVYLAPQPGDPPFVQPDETVAQGQTLVIIEAMKVMNPIQAPRAGIVKAIMVDDAQPVEFGDPLVVLA